MNQPHDVRVDHERAGPGGDEVFVLDDRDDWQALSPTGGADAQSGQAIVRAPRDSYPHHRSVKAGFPGSRNACSWMTVEGAAQSRPLRGRGRRRPPPSSEQIVPLGIVSSRCGRPEDSLACVPAMFALAARGKNVSARMAPAPKHRLCLEGAWLGNKLPRPDGRGAWGSGAAAHPFSTSRAARARGRSDSSGGGGGRGAAWQASPRQRLGVVSRYLTDSSIPGVGVKPNLAPATPGIPQWGRLIPFPRSDGNRG